AAVPRGRAVHGPAGALLQDRRHDPLVQGGRGGEARRHPRAGFLSRRHDRRGPREERAAQEVGPGLTVEGKLTLTIVTPEHAVVSAATCDEVTLPSLDGEVGILPGHTPLITLL